MKPINLKEKTKRPREFFRGILLRLMVLQRQHEQKIRDGKNFFISKLTHSHFFSLHPGPVCRGMAIGMFWAFIPMPFQMIPAFFFCWLGLANLPLAIICVWISNPFTYAPIFYAEYHIGRLLQGSADSDDLSFEQMNRLVDDHWDIFGTQFIHLYLTILEGSIFLSCVSAVAAYFAGFWISRRLLAYVRKRKRKRKQKTNASPH